MKKTIFLHLLLLLLAVSGLTQNTRTEMNTRSSIYVGYDLGEMAFNQFQNFAGEAGIQFENGHMLRFTLMNVKLTEQHLSSGFAGAVDGDDVSGLWNGYELLYDIPIYRFKRENTFIYGGVSAGHHKHLYQHSILAESISHKTSTVGFDIGYRETNVFKIRGLYINFQIPFRYYLTGLEETNLGDSTINKVALEQTISFFIGYQF